jgi:Mn-dependent DtxR family transcriptional regulator
MALNRQIVNDERNNDTGQFTEKYQEEDFIEALRSLGTAGTVDVAQEVGAPRRSAYNKLEALAESGRVNTRKIGAVRVWELGEDET